jgi:hypothetical protein
MAYIIGPDCLQNISLIIGLYYPFATIALVPPIATPQVVDAYKVLEGCKDEVEKIGEVGATELT